MFWNLLVVGFVSVFFVFGVACAVQMIVEACFPFRQLVTVVEIKTREEAQLLEMLLKEAKLSFLQKKSQRLGVHLSEGLCENETVPDEILQILKKYGAECYIVEQNEIE